MPLHPAEMDSPLPLGSTLAQPSNRSSDQPASPPSRVVVALPDKAALAQLLHRELLSSRRFGAEPALLLIAPHSLHRDGPQEISDLQRGAVLVALGDRLRARVRARDVVARVGQDLFAVILQNMAQVKPLLVQQRLARQLGGTYEVQQQGIALSLRMASACGVGQRLCARDLLGLALQALQGERQKIHHLPVSEASARHLLGR
ncbi:diguanylate cyclase domain-containing protein [Roseateles koreensis]|uniref:Diguanylate cyclase n=1 Tax=Roseateles koreensis TaxID=2987526 RepID=A0ABT5KPR0_9BURK|nr:diguanylate cyclase [Roseateles koreensis]MDC8784901.1 diguanylate cyclase [Roseateles koreensis]